MRLLLLLPLQPLNAPFLPLLCLFPPTPPTTWEWVESEHAALERMQTSDSQPIHPCLPILKKTSHYLNILIICCFFQLLPRLSSSFSGPPLSPLEGTRTWGAQMYWLFILHGAWDHACGSLLIPGFFLASVLDSDDCYEPNGHGQAWSLCFYFPFTLGRPDWMKYLFSSTEGGLMFLHRLIDC